MVGRSGYSILIQLSGATLLNVVEDLSKFSGGVPEAVRQLSNRLANGGLNVGILYAKGSPFEFTDFVKLTKSQPSKFGASWSWNSKLESDITSFVRSAGLNSSILHIHGVWSAPQYFAAKIAKNERCPFLISAHGMLEPWLWNNQGIIKYIKKKLYWHQFAYSVFRNAKAIHAITPIERSTLSKIFPNQLIEVIPNAIDIDHKFEMFNKYRKKSLLFIGRVDSTKGVDILLHAFAQSKIDQKWTLDIVGPIWSSKYHTFLKKIVKQNKMETRVTFHGALFNDEKFKLLDNAWALIAPSHSEVMGLVNLEAASRYLPTITTYQTGLHDWQEGGGVLTFPNINSISQAIEKVCSWGDSERNERAVASRELVKRRYSWEVTLPMWTDLYSRLL